jgi:hypothetical protein
MSRPPRGQKVIDNALQAIASATTIEQLRQAQAVVLPLHYGMSLEQTAQAVGLSRGWVCRRINSKWPCVPLGGMHPWSSPLWLGSGLLMLY